MQWKRWTGNSVYFFVAQQPQWETIYPMRTDGHEANSRLLQFCERA
jgi:hypothetical protein